MTRKSISLFQILVALALSASLALFPLPQKAYADVTFDAVGPNSAGAAATDLNTLSWSHTVSGSNTLLTVGIAVGYFDTQPTASVTFNGDPMTSAGIREADDLGAGYAQLFYLKAPDDGAHLVEVTLTGDVANTIAGGSVSFNGVDQSTPVSNVTTNVANGTSVSINVTSATGNMVVDAVAHGADITSSTQTNRWLRNINSETAAGNGAQSTAAGAASVSMGYSGESDRWGIVAMNVNAVPPPPRVIRLRGKVQIWGGTHFR